MHKFLLYFFIVSFAYSQTVNFDEVLNDTLNDNNDLKNSKLNINLSSLNIKEVNSFNYGKLNLQSEVNKTNHSGYIFNSKLSSREATFKDFGFAQMGEPIDTEPKDLNYPDSRTNVNTKLTYDIALFTGFKISTQKDIMKLEKKINKLKYDMNKTELSFEVFKAYNGAVIAKKYIKALKQTLISVDNIVKSALIFYKEGLTTSIDVKQAKAHKFEVLSNLQNAKNRFNFAISYLRFLSSNDKITDVNSPKKIDIKLYNKKELISQALKTKDSIKASKLYKKIMKKNIDISKSNYYPTIYSHLEYGYNDNRFNFSDDKDYYNALIGVKYTLFDGTRNIKVQKDKIKYLKAKINHKKQEDYVKMQINNALDSLETKIAILSAKQSSLDLTAKVFEQANKMYKNHLISMTDLLKQKSNYENVQAQFFDAKYQKYIAKAKVAKILNLDFLN
ncbi:TolC family protein [Arcobacter sp. CECT 8985]|uniref:TolC family protein n=1 Tax=Arcobacter sp. CECT 8985 TaxID=1935424 RepID=UPI00100B334B|nr:TolC family protein [Arcobacter sp. CECT 8985]RXJ87057.1 transporter [Arcobacter sp. CECT 8985]